MRQRRHLATGSTAGSNEHTLACRLCIRRSFLSPLLRTNTNKSVTVLFKRISLFCPSNDSIDAQHSPIAVLYHATHFAETRNPYHLQQSQPLSPRLSLLSRFAVFRQPASVERPGGDKLRVKPLLSHSFLSSPRPALVCASKPASVRSRDRGAAASSQSLSTPGPQVIGATDVRSSKKNSTS